MSSLAGYLLALPFKYQMSNVLMCRNQAFPSQLFRCQAASCLVSFAGPARSSAFIWHVIHTTLHLRKARWGQLGLISSLSITALRCACDFVHKPLFSVRKGSRWAPCTRQERMVYFTNHCLESEVYLSTQCSWRLRELQNACYENYFAHVNGTSFNDSPQAISVSFYLLSPSLVFFFFLFNQYSQFFIEI